MNSIYLIGVYLVWFLSTYFLVFFMLVIITSRKDLYEPRRFTTRKRPMVTVIVPAYNEEGKIAETIASLKLIEYKNIEFIVVNDGSKDGTSKEVVDSIRGDPRFRFIDRKINKGKAASMNEAIAKARGEYVAAMDADSIVDPDVFEKTLPYFEDDRIGAVTITVQVKDPKKFLHKIIDLEFIIGLSLFLKTFSFFDCIFVTPGPFSVFRKSVLEELGGFDANNITEDLEIAYRIQRAGYGIENCMEAKVYTICPPTFKQVYIQRRRWYTGAIQTLVKHRGVMFDKRAGMFGFFIPFNYLLILLGMVLFYASTYLMLSRLWKHLWNMRHTGFDILRDLQYFELDFFRLGRVSLVGFTAFLLTFILLYMGLRYTRQRYSEKAIGIIGYPLLFFLYQIYWTGAWLSVMRGRKVKWR